MDAGLAAQSSSGGRRRVRRRHVPVAQINVTPMVDVMLVLLIIFMVAAPLLTVGVPIDLPKTAAKPLESQTEPITVSIEANGKIFLQENEVTPDRLVATLQAIARNGTEQRIFVRGDRAADYGTIMRVMGQLNAAGYNQIGLVTVEDTDG
ncbi:protein TolR [Propylenella binzhouense]|uniref:Protein TolR n=1 Tax=Propylenella binzhouense TaxID=2555902 RepID=A0A964WTM4_9HYPH|nr:protein TolR [Propylenella binzhouense]MYZ48126.1 protein TolR [Propylenella binzhouense]